MGRRHLGALVAAAVLLTPLAACGNREVAATPSFSTGTLPPPAPTAAPAPAPPPAPAATPPPSTSPPPPPATTAAPKPRPLTRQVPLPASVDPYRGLGTWVDVYDWSRTFGRAVPLVVADDVDRMAAYGVQTLYIQVSKWDSPVDVLDPDLLLPIIARARARGLRVVAWYLPTLEDPGADLRRMVAIAGMGVDGFAVDIESKKVPDLAERNRRLVELSAGLRRALPNQAIGAIVLPPVVLEAINPRYWPAFPYREIAPYYDVWLTMGYWTNRTWGSGWRDGYRYTIENVTRLRQNLGIPGAPVHVIGGIGDDTIPADIGGMNRAAGEHGALGGSLYDWRTTHHDLWSYLQPLRWPRP